MIPRIRPDLSTGLQREVEKFYGKNKPSVATRLSNIMAAAKRKPQAFLKGLRAVRDYSGVTVTSDIFGISPQMVRLRPQNFTCVMLLLGDCERHCKLLL